MRDISGVGEDELGLQILERGHPFLCVVVEVALRQAVPGNVADRPVEIKSGSTRRLLSARLSGLYGGDTAAYT